MLRKFCGIGPREQEPGKQDDDTVVPLSAQPAYRPSPLRKVLCKLDLCTGPVEHEQDLYGTWWVGMRCLTCRKLLHPIKSKYQEKPSVAGENDEHREMRP